MRRGILGTILWACVAACIGVGLFFVKHEVKDQERRLNALNTEIQRNQETIHVLRAEWSYLNDPARLRALSEKHLGMHPVMPNQVATLDGIMRNGVPSANMLASAAPVRPSAQAPTAVPAPTARPSDQPAKQQIKLVDNQSRPRPVDSGKPNAPKPPPSKPGGVTMANAAPPPTANAAPPPTANAAPPPPVPSSLTTSTPALAPAHAVSAATTPARGRSIIIQSPALAQREGDVR